MVKVSPFKADNLTSVGICSLCKAQHKIKGGNSAHFFTLLQATKENGMDLQGASASGTSGASLELASLKLAKSQQEQEGQASLQLLESASDVPKSSSSNPVLGANIDTYA
jgi:hypothetical protein